jgi:hypothetical protein
MAKPINLYQGPAPAAMGMMGQGILEAGANIGRTIQGGYESMGKSLGEGIKSAASSVAGAYTQSKDDQAKFDATKKMVKAFEGYLPKQKDPVTGKEFSPMADELKGFLNDTTVSTREKVAMTPMVMSFLGNAQQQYGRESVANIMAGSRVEAAGARRPAPMTGSTFGGVPTLDSIFNSPVGQTQPQSSGNLSELPMNPSQGNPAPLLRTVSSEMPSQQGQPASRMTLDGKMEVWSSRLNKYVEIDNPMQDIQY